MSLLRKLPTKTIGGILVLLCTACTAHHDTKQNKVTNPIQPTVEVNREHPKTPSLKGEVLEYTFSETNDCNIETVGDCDGGYILFLNDSIYIMEDFCLYDNTYSNGKYEWKNNNLVLYDSGYWIKEAPENEEDTESRMMLTYTRRWKK